MAEWGVDFIKYDDLVPFPEEIKGIAKAIEQSGRPMVYSLSPGNGADPNHIEAFKTAHMLRVTADIWDEQKGIDEAFEAWRKWQGKEEPGFWVDMDMIPFGQLQLISPKPDGVCGDESKAELIKKWKPENLKISNSFQEKVFIVGVILQKTKCTHLLPFAHWQHSR